jgi:hypothetical protein
MNEPFVQITLDNAARAFNPEDTLCGQYCLHGTDNSEVRAVELSVLWHTEGKGDEDMSVRFFERVEAAGGDFVDFQQPRRFTCTLPNSPLSYDGYIVKIRWCVRVRVFLSRGKELSAEVPFQLGAVPHPQPIAP